MKAILQGFYQKEHFWLRLGVVLLAVFGMGFALSLLLLVDMGTDPCSMMNKAISAKTGMSFGNWQALMNTVLLVLVVIFGGRNLGFGTLANMFLIGSMTVIMILALGPVIQWLGDIMKKHFPALTGEG